MNFEKKKIQKKACLSFWTTNQVKERAELATSPCPLTIVLSFDKALPLPEPLHADAVYDHWRLLLLERLVQL